MPRKQSPETQVRSLKRQLNEIRAELAMYKGKAAQAVTTLDLRCRLDAIGVAISGGEYFVRVQARKKELGGDQSR